MCVSFLTFDFFLSLEKWLCTTIKDTPYIEKPRSSSYAFIVKIAKYLRSTMDDDDLSLPRKKKLECTVTLLFFSNCVFSSLTFCVEIFTVSEKLL